jgi:zinc protease
MINFEQFSLSNGLQVFVHQDPKSLIAAFNLCYGVGSRDEDPEKTGFAHLFEHLMFGGSVNVPAFDEPVQKAGGMNNAFTSLDITNYYITLPYQNIETAFWLESDRMLSLSFDPKVLAVQKSVVIEEFKQRYLNQPYGDLWLKLRPLVYKKHPYRWATIGKELSHIENATMEDVKDFFFRFYRPNNAVLVVAGKVDVAQVRALAEKWFGDIPAGPSLQKVFPKEEEQTQARYLLHTADVPVKSLYKVFRTPEKYSKEAYALDLFADALGRGQTSALYQKLVKDNALFTSLSAHHSSYQDSGLFVINGSLSDDVTFEEADAAVCALLKEEIEEVDYSEKLSKVKVQALSLEKFGETEVLNRAMKLAFAAISGDPNRCNTSLQIMEEIDPEFLKITAKKYLKEQFSNTLFYSPKA